MICGDSMVHGCLRCCEGVGVLVDIEGGVLSRPKHSELYLQLLRTDVGTVA